MLLFPLSSPRSSPRQEKKRRRQRFAPPFGDVMEIAGAGTRGSSSTGRGIDNSPAAASTSCAPIDLCIAYQNSRIFTTYLRSGIHLIRPPRFSPSKAPCSPSTHKTSVPISSRPTGQIHSTRSVQYPPRSKRVPTRHNDTQWKNLTGSSANALAIKAT